MIIDTETCDKHARKTSKPEPWNSLVYDLGYVVVDSKTFEQVDSGSFVIAETFNNPKLMNSAYYANKLPQYLASIKLDGTGDWQMISALDLWRKVKDVIKKYNIRKVWAYNCTFDMQALSSTIRTYSNDYVPYFMPCKVKFCDIWDYASCITATKDYIKFCGQHGFFTASGNPKTSAETVYAYLTKNPDYIERHTAYEDALIESYILKCAKTKHTKKRSTVGRGWVDCAALYKTM